MLTELVHLPVFGDHDDSNHVSVTVALWMGIDGWGHKEDSGYTKMEEATQSKKHTGTAK